MATVSKKDVEQKLRDVESQLADLERERGLLLHRKDFLEAAMKEFFSRDGTGHADTHQQNSSEETPEIPSKAQLREMNTSDVAELVFKSKHNEWMTARKLTTAINGAGKAVSYKAVFIALKRNGGKRFESRMEGKVKEWRLSNSSAGA